MSIKHYEYNAQSIEFEEVNGQVMANATSMAKAFGKTPANIFRTITWKEYESTVAEDLLVRCADLHTVKNGDGGGSWIHQELVVEFARRLNPKFALWCNRKIAELMRTGKTEITKPLSPEEVLLQQVQLMVAQAKRIEAVETKVKEIEAKTVTSPTNYYTVAGYASIHGVKIDSPTAAKLGKKTSSLCTANGYMIGKTHDPRFGSVNTYPVEALDIVFAADGYRIIE